MKFIHEIKEAVHGEKYKLPEGTIHYIRIVSKTGFPFVPSLVNSKGVIINFYNNGKMFPFCFTIPFGQLIDTYIGEPLNHPASFQELEIFTDQFAKNYEIKLYMIR